MYKFFIYCRKSSEQEDRQILSLESQEKELLQLSRELSLEIVGVYKEAGSAHVIGRKLFNEMLERIEAGEANGIIVWDESRIARNSLDGGRVVYMMDMNQIKEIVKPGKSYKNTPDDKSWLSMSFMMSKKESDDKGVNVKRGLRTKASKGWYPSSFSPPGYIWDRFAERGNKELLNDPVRFELIRNAWDLMLSGNYTVPQILKKLNTDWGYRTYTRKRLGGKPMARSQLYKIFNDTFYYGEYEYPKGSGNYFVGNHIPMINKAEYNRVQLLLGRKGNPRAKTMTFPFTGLISCGECGASVTAEEKIQVICSGCKFKFSSKNRYDCPKCQTSIEDMVKPKLLTYTYYHCTKSKAIKCAQKSIEAIELERQMSIILGQINIHPAFKDWAVKYLNELHDQNRGNHKMHLDTLSEQYKNCTKKLENLLSLKISPQNVDGLLLNDEEYYAQKAILINEKHDLEERIKNLGVRVEEWLKKSETAFEFASSLLERFKNGTPDEKKQIISTIGSNLVLQDKKLAFQVRMPFDIISEITKSDAYKMVKIEPEEKIDVTAKYEDSMLKNPSLLRD